MDSMDFMRTCLWNCTRDECDDVLRSVLVWVSLNATPERVFHEDKLALWAHENGYTTNKDLGKLVSLLREAAQFVPRHTILATSLATAISDFG